MSERLKILLGALGGAILTLLLGGRRSIGGKSSDSVVSHVRCSVLVVRG